MGPSGAGHFVKMVHNGVEYGLMQAYAEGFELMRASEFDPTCTRSPSSGVTDRSSAAGCSTFSPARSRKTPGLEGIRGYVEDSGEGRWTVEQAIESAVPSRDHGWRS